jgi:ribulose-5-phosphate 4-epimerase/fuculose-1-phosphate aldolase
MRVGALPVIPYLKPGSPKIAEELAKRAADNRAFLLANHGPIVTGSDLVDAVDNMEELEETAKLALLLAGRKVNYLTDIEISELKAR